MQDSNGTSIGSGFVVFSTPKEVSTIVSKIFLSFIDSVRYDGSNSVLQLNKEKLVVTYYM